MMWRDVGGVCYLFRLVKRKNMFIKTNMTRDTNTLRCEIKITITKMRGAIA
jgi:hypothetical protein